MHDDDSRPRIVDYIDIEIESKAKKIIGKYEGRIHNEKKEIELWNRFSF